MTDIPPATLRQAALVMADWLEGRHFGVTSLSDDERTAALCAP